MKKIITFSIIFLFIGIIVGNKIHSATTSLENAFQEGSTYYFLQEGVYSNETIMKENTASIPAKIIEKINNKYYVYLGITKDEKNSQKIKKILMDKGYDIYIKEVNINNEEFFNNLTQFDLLINNTNNSNEILTITEVILANYEEIIKKQ